MNCQELQDHYELFALGVAEDPERSEIHAHLNRKCEACMAGVKRALETAAMLSATASQATPSRKLRGRILASVGAEPRRFPWAPLWAALAVLSLALGIYVNQRNQREIRDLLHMQSDLLSAVRQAETQRAEIARLTEAFAIVNGPGTKEAVFGGARPTPPRGKVFLNPAQGVLLIASNLPPTPVGKLYEMWLIPKGGKPVAAGLFQSQTDGTAMHIRRGAVDVAATGVVAVTVENEAGVDQPTTQPLIAAPVESSPR